MKFFSGILDLPWWGYVLYTVGMTHITIASVTIYLHRYSAHSALELNGAVQHFFRAWLWLTTGMRTKEWAAVHRKHHARVETVEDPHSPQILGIKKVLSQGTELYKKAAADPETLQKHGGGTPTDWLERNLYHPHNITGIALLLVLDTVLFGAIGVTIWAVQMLWIPVFAAGIINGVGHYWGTRNFDTPDTSTNILRWGILIGGEELHNNHHAFPSSAKLSIAWYEFDIGWLYIRLFQALGLARVKKLPPQIVHDPRRTTPDREALEAVLEARFKVLARFDKVVKKFKEKEAHVAAELRQNLQKLWERSLLGQEELLAQLREWCEAAKKSGVPALQRFAFWISGVRKV